MKKNISLMLVVLLICLVGCSTKTVELIPAEAGQIEMNSSGAFLIDGDKKLWAYGSNVDGELGLGWDIYKTGDPMLVMEDVVKVSTANGTNSSGFALVLKTDGSVWQWGPYTNEYDAGEYKNNNAVLPKKIFDDAIDIVMTELGGIAVKSNGEVWAWGSNVYGVVPDSTGLSLNKEPYLIMKNAKQVYAQGWRYSVITMNGDLYCWGKIFDTLQYTPIKMMSNVKKIATGYVLKQDNSLWGFGNNAWGQFGNGKDTGGNSKADGAIVTTPLKIADDVKDFSSSSLTLYYIKEDNTLWGCGSNRSGQLGNGVEAYQEDRIENKPILIDSNVSKVYCVIDVLFYVKNDALWACGANLSGMLGLGTACDPQAEFGTYITTTPQKVLDGNVIDLYVNNNYRVLCVMEDGSLKRWGADPLFFFFKYSGTEKEAIPKEYANLFDGTSESFMSMFYKAFFNTPQKITLPEGFTARTE